MKIFQGAEIIGLVLLLAACASTTGGGAMDEKNRSRSAEASAQLGLGYLQQGKFDLARQKLEHAIELNPDLPDAHHYLGELYQQTEQFDQAEKHYRRALSLNPRDAMLKNNFGVFLCRRGKLTEAESQFLAAGQDPFYETRALPYKNAGLCALQAKDTEKAEKYFRTALSFDARMPAALYEMANLKFQQREYFQARAFLQRYFAVAPPTPQILWLGVRLERELDDKAAAAEYSEQLKTRFPDSEETAHLMQSERQ